MIPFFDYRPQLRELRAEIDAAVARVLDSGRLILAAEVAAFEREFAAWVGAAGAVGVNSGTDALILALRAVGVGPGDEVITVANAGAPPVAAVRAVGALPRLVDVEPQSLQIDPARLGDALTGRTRCLLPVHLYGQPAALDPLLRFAERHGLHVVEDCAQAHGARYGGRHVGTFGRVGCFSFYPTKNLGAYGDGGVCVTDDPAVERRLRLLRQYGYRGDRESHVEGLQSRLDELQAAVLRVKLRRLDRALAQRAELARAYREGLTDIALPAPPAACTHAYHLFVVRPPSRERAVAALDRAGIGHAIHYPVPVHRMEAYAFLGYPAGSLPETERACRGVLSLPLYPGLGAEAVERVVAALRDAA